VAVLGVPDKIYGQKVVAALILEEGKNVTIENLLDYCEGKIAIFKKPREIFIFEEFPLTKTHKLDRKHLKKQILS
jgi:acyl-CoA synthetase (AMP-forming)/AMP-acid ligase II